MKATMEKYGSRNWSVWLILPDGERELVAVTVYKRGAESVLAMVNALIRN
ncbi:MAG: hypothetical protein WC451_05285 [Patescibacteria group bacterium]